MRSIVEWVGFQLVWLTCAIGAAQGRTAPGVLVAALFIAGVLSTKRWSSSECLAILISGMMGLMVDSALAYTGLVRFAAPWPSSHFAPAWLVALWFAFGATVSALTSWLGKHLVTKASIVGAIAGPFAYWAGERLAALEIVGSVPYSYIAIALIWALALPALLKIQQRMTLLTLPDARRRKG